MRYKVSFKHMESSTALADYAWKRLSDRIHKHLMRPIELNVTFSVEKGRHLAHCQILAGGVNISAEAQDDLMYATVDRLAERVEAQLRRHKERLRHRKYQKVGRFQGFPLKRSREDEPWDAGDLLKFEEARRRRLHAVS